MCNTPYLWERIIKNITTNTTLAQTGKALKNINNRNAVNITTTNIIMAAISVTKTLNTSLMAPHISWLTLDNIHMIIPLFAIVTYIMTYIKTIASDFTVSLHYCNQQIVLHYNK